jgi:beta-glucosidase
MWVKQFGEESARARFEASAVRLLLNSFRTGLFENPYLDPATTASIVGKPEFMQAGYEAQLKSVVMVKNHGKALPEIPGQAGNDGKKKVFVPERYFPQTPGMFGLSMGAPGHWDYPVDKALVEKYFDWAVEPEEADFALVVIEEPKAGSGYDVNDRKKGGNGYVPISLQYRPYKAEYARKESIAGGDPKEDFTNRSYKGKTVTTYNEKDLDLVMLTKKQMGNKPVVVVVRATRPVVLSELEPYADAVLIAFGVQNQAVLDLVSGAAEPSGLLPMQFPADMRTVEEQQEDVPHDMRPLVDADGNAWDFAYGMNWSGVIDDARTAKYRK